MASPRVFVRLADRREEMRLCLRRKARALVLRPEADHAVLDSRGTQLYRWRWSAMLEGVAQIVGPYLFYPGPIADSSRPGFRAVDVGPALFDQVDQAIQDVRNGCVHIHDLNRRF